MRRYAIGLSILAAVMAVVTGASAVTALERRAITEKDLFAFVWVADPQISPDGSRVAFVRVAVDEKKDQYDTAIWLVPTDGSEPPRAFTSGQRDNSPRWSPDGRHLVFTRVTDKDGRPQPPQLYVITLGGGEPRAITDLPKGAANPVWSPDGKTIAFSSSTKPERSRQAALRQARGRASSERRSGRHPGRLPRERRRRLRFRRQRSAGAGLDRSRSFQRRAPCRGEARDLRRVCGLEPSVVARWNEDPLRLRPAPRVVLLSGRQRSLRGLQGWRRARQGREHRGHDRRLRPGL